MYRTTDSSEVLNTSRDDHEDVFNSSYNTAQSLASNNSSSSKAVLAALRALQDKIRRLEAERSQALDETIQLRHQLKNQEIEADHMKQKENLIAQKSLHEIKSAYDRLLMEKTDMEVRLSSLEDRNRSSQHISEDLQSKIRSLEEEKQSSGLRVKELEHQQKQVDIQIKHSQQKEKEMAETMVWESKRHEDEVGALHRRVQSLQNDLSHSSQEKGTTDVKLMELDRLVSQLLTVNESLVAQLSGKPSRSGSPAKRRVSSAPTGTIGESRKKSSKGKKVTVPRAATTGTIASDAAKVTKFSMRQHSQLIPVKTDEVEQLRSMHKIYADMARKISSTPSSDTKKKSKVSSSDASVASVRSTGSAGSSRGTTRVSRKKAQLLERFEEDEAERTAAYNYSNHHQHSGTHPGDSHILDVRLPKPSISFDYTANRSNHNGTSASGLNSSVHSSMDQQQFEDSLDAYGSESFANRSSLSTPMASSGGILRNSYNGNGSGSGIGGKSGASSKAEIQNVISSLEDEFDALNQQYRRLLSTVDSPHDSNVLFNGSKSNGSGDAVQAQAEEIVSVIQQLHRKGEQLRSLKSP